MAASMSAEQVLDQIFEENKEESVEEVNIGESLKGFKRILAAGSRKGHKVWLIVSEEKEFVFTYKNNEGKLLISFYFGKWNVNGFPQHS